MTTLGDLSQQLRNETDRALTAINRIAAIGRQLDALDALDADKPVLVPVPYRSQHDPDAQTSRLDCGPACVAMLLEWRGTHIVRIDEIARQTGTGATNAEALSAVALKYGLRLRKSTPMSLADVDAQIQAGKPMIALVRYSDFGDQRQDLAYAGLHWIVIVGVDADNVYVNDPDWWGSRREEGKCRPISRAMFDHAWGNTMPEAYERQALVVA